MSGNFDTLSLRCPAPRQLGVTGQAKEEAVKKKVSVA